MFKIHFGSFWRSNLTEYAVVFAFLSPAVMASVGEKVRRDMQKGSLFISSSFPVSGLAARSRCGNK